VVRNHLLLKKSKLPPKRQGFFWNQRTRDKDPNAMDVDEGARNPIKYYNCNKPGHIAKQCWYKGENVRRIEEEKIQKALKENRS